MVIIYVVLNFTAKADYQRKCDIYATLYLFHYSRIFDPTLFVLYEFEIRAVVVVIELKL